MQLYFKSKHKEQSKSNITTDSTREGRREVQPRTVVPPSVMNGDEVVSQGYGSL